MRQKKENNLDMLQQPQDLQRHGLRFDIDLVSKSIYDEIPSVSSEMLYRAQLDLNSKVYIIMMSFGILLLLYVAFFV